MASDAADRSQQEHESSEDRPARALPAHVGPDTTKLDLSGSDLTELPPALFGLAALEELNIAQNKLVFLPRCASLGADVAQSFLGQVHGDAPTCAQRSNAVTSQSRLCGQQLNTSG